MYSPNPLIPQPKDEGGPLVVPQTYMGRVDQARVSQKQLRDKLELIKKTSKFHPDAAGERTEEIFAQLLRELIPEHFKVVTRARIQTELPEDSPQLDIVILKPGGDRLLSNMNYFPRENVLAAFECKLTLRRSHLAEAAAASNALKGDFADGTATYSDDGTEHCPTCKPYFGVLALSWDGGDGLDQVSPLVDLMLETYRGCPLGRQPDCILLPEVSFSSMLHDSNILGEGIDFGVRHEPSLAMYKWPDGRERAFRPISTAKSSPKPLRHDKLAHHNPLLGLGSLLARILGEFSADYRYLSQAYSYYGHHLHTTYRPYIGPAFPVQTGAEGRPEDSAHA